MFIFALFTNVTPFLTEFNSHQTFIVWKVKKENNFVINLLLSKSVHLKVLDLAYPHFTTKYFSFLHIGLHDGIGRTVKSKLHQENISGWIVIEDAITCSLSCSY